jgi:PKD domain
MRKRGLVAVGLFVIVGAVAAPSSAFAAGWLPSSLISSPGENRSESTQPAVAVAPSGNATVVWSDEVNPSGLNIVERVQSRTYFANGAVGPIHTLSETAEIAGDPQIDVDGNGVATVAWEFGACCAPGVEFVRLDPNGVPMGTPEPLSPTDDGTGDLGLDVNSSGEALVSWANFATGVAQFVRIAPNGTVGTVTDLSQIASPDQLQDSGGIAIDEEGRGFATWSEFDGDVGCCQYIVQGRTINPDDSLDPIRLLSNDTGFPNEIESLIDSAGMGTAIWGAQESSDPFNNIVYANQINASGNAGSTRVLSDDALQSFSPHAAVGPDDAVTAIWQESTSPEDNLRSRQIDSSGTLGPLRTVISGSFEPMELAFSSSGAGMVTYNNQESGPGRMAAHPIDSTGAPIGSEALLTPDDGKTAEEGVVALGPDGSGMAVWQRPNPDFDDDYNQIEGAVFDGSPPTLNAVIPGGGTAGEAMVMAATGSDRSQVTFAWNFGDGGSGAGDIVQHTYGSPGTYTVTVTATDGVGNVATAQGQVKISPVGAPPPTATTQTGRQAAALKKCKKVHKKKKRKKCIKRAKKLPV